MFCLDCSVSLLLFSNIWEFIYLAEVSIQKKKKGKKSQVDELGQFLLFVPATWEEADVEKKKN